MTGQFIDNLGYPAPVFKFGATQVVAYTATAASSAALGDETRLVHLWPSTDCHILIGPSPQTADANDVPLTAKIATVVRVNPGDVISVIRQTDNGNLYVTELES